MPLLLIQNEPKKLATILCQLLEFSSFLPKETQAYLEQDYQGRATGSLSTLLLLLFKQELPFLLSYLIELFFDSRPRALLDFL